MQFVPTKNYAQSNHRSLLGPAWRSEVAKIVHPRNSINFSCELDPWVRDLASYLALRVRGNSDSTREKFQAIADAVVLQGNCELTAKLKLMALGQMDVDEMSRRVAVPVDTLQAWEALFFDVRDQREATSWLASCVIAKERKAGDPGLASQMKLALAGGVVAVRVLLDTEAEMPLDEADRVYQRRLRLDLKLNEVLEMPIDSEPARLRFFSNYTETQLEMKRLELACRRLEERSVQARERHELARLRAELARERENRRATQEQRLAETRHECQSAKQRCQSQTHDLRKYRERAEQMALEARIAASALAQLGWGNAAATTSSVSDTEHTPPLSKELWPTESATNSAMNETSNAGSSAIGKDALAFDFEQVISATVENQAARME